MENNANPENKTIDIETMSLEDMSFLIDTAQKFFSASALPPRGAAKAWGEHLDILVYVHARLVAMQKEKATE